MLPAILQILLMTLLSQIYFDELFYFPACVQIEDCTEIQTVACMALIEAHHLAS